MSIFTKLFPKNYFMDNFWTVKEPSMLKLRTKPIIYQANLSFTFNQENFKDQLVKLNSKLLYFYDKDCRFVYVKLRTSLITPFTQGNSQDLKFGFSIQLNSLFKQDFFVGNESDLKMWIKLLRKISIFSNFEEDFVVIKDIDSGRFGSVKLCQSVSSQDSEKYAVKQVKKSKLTEIKLVQQLFNEISFLRKFSSKYITKLYQVYEDDSKVYLILEYVPHGNLLKRILSKKKFSESEVNKFSYRLFSVIKHIHSFGILHRDLKPENILLTSPTKIHKFKIADFGLSCYIDRSQKMKSGSPGYMAPEILRGRNYSTKIDIFSGGIIIYILLTGYSPFSCLDQNKTLEMNMICKLDFENRLFKHLSEDCITFLKNILEAEPALRFTASAALQDPWMNKENHKKLMTVGSYSHKNKNLRSFNRVVGRLIVF